MHHIHGTTGNPSDRPARPPADPPATARRRQRRSRHRIAAAVVAGVILTGTAELSASAAGGAAEVSASSANWIADDIGTNGGIEITEGIGTNEGIGSDRASRTPVTPVDGESSPSGIAARDQGGQDGVTCAGRVPTITGTPGADVTGGAGDDVIVAFGPDIEVWANGGHDLVCVFTPAGHGGYNAIHLGPGDDTVLTVGGANDVFGYDGADTAYLNGTSEWAEMGDGDDVVWALGAESVTAEGGDGWDVLVGSPGTDHLVGGAGYDVALGADGDDVLVGDTGNDVLLGGAGWDHLDGGDHFDECHDHQGADGADVVSCETVVLSPAAALPEAA